MTPWRKKKTPAMRRKPVQDVLFVELPVVLKELSHLVQLGAVNDTPNVVPLGLPFMMLDGIDDRANVHTLLLFARRTCTCG
jgi:hypothetical protein